MNCLSGFAEKMLSNFIAGYRKSYSLYHILTKLIEDWKKQLDNKNRMGTVLMDFSIRHQIILQKLAYSLVERVGFIQNTIFCFYLLSLSSAVTNLLSS